MIPLGIDTHLFRPGPKDKQIMKKLDLKKEDINILFTGRLIYDKGIEDLIYAFYMLRKKHDNVNLLILGRGKLRKKIDSLIERFDLKDSVQYLGFLTHPETPRYYKTADIFCTPCRITPYWQEQFGFVFAEAMACGKAIVSTYSGSIPEVTGGNAVLVPPGNHLELYQALDKVVSDKRFRKELGRKARDHAVKTFSCEVVTAKRLKVYEKVYSEHKRSLIGQPVKG